MRIGVRSDRYKGRAGGCRVDLQGDLRDHIQQACGIGGVDLVPGIGRPVIVGMQAREKEQDGNFSGDEGDVVAGGVAADGVLEIEIGVFLEAADEGLERRAGADAADVDRVLADAADHVHIQHGDVLAERSRRFFYPFGGAEQAKLFARKGCEQDASLQACP